MSSPIKESYVTGNSITCTSLNSLASTSACQCTTIDNTVNFDLDHFVSATIKAGSSPGAGAVVSVYIAAMGDGGLYPDNVSGSDSTFTFPTVPNITLAKQIAVNTTNAYPSQPFSVRAVLGFMPYKYALVFVNSTGVALASSGNTVSYTREQNTVG